MQAYKITAYGESRPEYIETLAAAHKFIKDLSLHPQDHSECRIELVSFSVDKASVLKALSGWGMEETILKTWRLTARGGLVECNNGE